MIRQAHDAGMLTAPYCFSAEEAAAMARAGADIIVAHCGLTTGGAIGASTAMSLDEAVTRVQVIRDAAVASASEVIVLCHGGPIATPADVTYVLRRTTGVAGFFGASSVERLPTETAIAATVRAFKEIAPGAIEEPVV
jgi:predicted TIM-barrel enzyme